MSIDFHSQYDGCVRLNVPSLGTYFREVLFMTLDRELTSDELRKLIHPCHHTHEIDSESEWKSKLRTAFASGLELYLVSGPNSDMHCSVCAYNTVLVANSDPIRLLARLWGRSLWGLESTGLHAYVEGSNRKWLAEIIARGCKSGIFLTAEWEEVATFLSRSDEHPIVTSFTHCAGFPNETAALSGEKWHDLKNPDDGDSALWIEQSGEAQWQYALEGVRHLRNKSELKPETWDTYQFEGGTTGYDLIAYAKSS